MPTMRKALAALSFLTAAASCWLTVMFFVLRHRGYEWRALMTTLFIVQSLVTLVALSGYLHGGWIRILLLVGACGIVIAGVQAMVANASNVAHGEGYVDVIALALILQGALTMWVFTRSPSPVRG
jgi:hypothetical protein